MEKSNGIHTGQSREHHVDLIQLSTDSNTSPDAKRTSDSSGIANVHAGPLMDIPLAAETVIEPVKPVDALPASIQVNNTVSMPLGQDPSLETSTATTNEAPGADSIESPAKATQLLTTAPKPSQRMEELRPAPLQLLQENGLAPPLPMTAPAGVDLQRSTSSSANDQTNLRSSSPKVPMSAQSLPERNDIQRNEQSSEGSAHATVSLAPQAPLSKQTTRSSAFTGRRSEPRTPGAIPLSATQHQDFLPSPSQPSRMEKRGTQQATVSGGDATCVEAHHAALERQPYTPLPIPPAPLVLLMSFPVLLAYLRVNLTLFIIGSIVTWYAWANWKQRQARRYDFGPEWDQAKCKGVKPKWIQESYKGETVKWMNYALRALFPLISTDLLVPFIDLLEDAMLEQVPPIVSSVRLVSPSLGEEPVQIVSMRPMSDAEWFDNLNEPPRDKKDLFDKLLKMTGLKAREPEQGKEELESQWIRARKLDQRKKRDRILREIGGRRGQGVGTDKGHEVADQDQDEGHQGHDKQAEGTNVRGEDNEDGGEYVNFAVDFSYDGRKNRPGYDLHFLAYIGMGLKGLGGVELRESEERSTTVSSCVLETDLGRFSTQQSGSRCSKSLEACI